jgi:diguanylate cyclase (GGDEF)-like protein
LTKACLYANIFLNKSFLTDRSFAMDTSDSKHPAPPELENQEKLVAENMQLRGEIIKLQSTVSVLLQKEEDRTAREASHRRELVELQMLATKDQLTGLLNRRGLEEALLRYLAYVARVIERGDGQPQIATFVYIDFDRFKPVNDLFSHRTGDILLMKIGKILKDTLRPNDYIAHLSGDEFAVVLKNVGERALAEHVISKIRLATEKITIDNADPAQLELLYRATGRRHVLEFSAGYFVITNGQLDPRQIEDIAENDVPKFSALRPHRGEYVAP